MTLSYDQTCNLDRLIDKRYHSDHIANLTCLPFDVVHEYRVARKKARHGACRDRVKPLADPLLPALLAWSRVGCDGIRITITGDRNV